MMLDQRNAKSAITIVSAQLKNAKTKRFATINGKICSMCDGSKITITVITPFAIILNVTYDSNRHRTRCTLPSTGNTSFVEPVIIGNDCLTSACHVFNSISTRKRIDTNYFT